MLILPILLAGPALPERRDDLVCRSVPEALERLRGEGARVAYSEGMLSHLMLVRSAPHRGDLEQTVRDLVEPHRLTVDMQSDGTILVVPQAELDSAELRRLRRDAGPLLQRRTSRSVLPEWAVDDPSRQGEGRADMAEAGAGPLRAVRLTVNSSDLDGTSIPVPLDPTSVDVFVLELDPSVEPSAARRFALRRWIVDLASRAPRARIGLEGSREQLEAFVDEETAAYVEGYALRTPTAESWLPASDATASVWRSLSGWGRHPLETLLDAASAGVDLVVVADAPPNVQASGMLEAVASSGVGVLEKQPTVLRSGNVWTRVFFEPDSGRYYVAVLRFSDTSEVVGLRLEPMAGARVLAPSGRNLGVELDGALTYLHLGSGSQWWVELEPEQTPDRSARSMVEAEVLVDPYEVVVRNQAFQERERRKVVSLEVTEWATIVPRWRDGRQSRWEHRIFQRRGQLDEYLHLNVWRDGVPVPKDKLYKGVLSRPIDRIEQEPLRLEQRDAYDYEYLGQEEIEGHRTWKVGFRPRVEGRLVDGIVWIDQNTGAHRRIRSHHKSLDPGIVAGDYVTEFGWVADEGSCFWDWTTRTGMQTYDYLDSVGSAQIEYLREDFQYNRPGVEDRLVEAHASDVLIHVATPPEGHRWLLKGNETKERRGDLSYPDIVQPDQQPLAALSREERRYGDTFDAQQFGAFRGVLAGVGAFASRARVTAAWFGGTGDVESDLNFGFDFSDLDAFGSSGRSGRRPWYLRLGGYGGDEGLISLTRPELFGSSWSWTTSIDLAFDPQSDFLFALRDEGAGDENNVADLSLDVTEVGLRTSVARSFGRRWIGRFHYHATEMSIDRRSGTDASFVVPLDTTQHAFGFSTEFGGKALWFEGEAETGFREEWQRWGLDGRQEERSSWFRFGGRGTWAKHFTPSQTLSATTGLFVGRDMDRFSRYRLFEVDARVPGYSSSIGFDEMVHVALAYNFRVWKLPFAFRIDSAEMGFSDDPVNPNQPDQELVGVQLQLSLHGPFETDLLLGAGRGVHAFPSRGEEETYFWVFLSRRFGGGS